MPHQPSGALLTPPIAQVSAICLPFPKTKCNDLMTIIIEVFILCRHDVLLCDITIILKLRQMNLSHISGIHIFLHSKFQS